MIILEKAIDAKQCENLDKLVNSGTQTHTIGAGSVSLSSVEKALADLFSSAADGLAVLSPERYDKQNGASCCIQHQSSHQLLVPCWSCVPRKQPLESIILGGF